MLLDRCDEFLRVGVEADVHDLEAGPFAHHAHQVLADVMQVALDRAQQDGADQFDAAGDQLRAQHVQPGGHGVGGHEHLGDEHIAGLEADAHLGHAHHQAVVQQFFGGHAFAQAPFGQFLRRIGIAFDDGSCQSFQNITHGFLLP